MKYCPQCANELVDKVIDGYERKVCPSPDCDFVYWANPVPVVAALVQYQGKVLLARNTKWPGGIFSLITGFLEKNEAPELAVLREVKEEIGLDGEVKKFIGHYPFRQMNQIILAFWVEAHGEIVTNYEIAEVELISRDELKKRPFDKLSITRQIVADWLKMS